MAEIEAQVFSVEDKNANHDKIKSDLKAKSSNSVDLQTSCINLTTKLVTRLEREHFWAGRAVTVLPAIAPWTYGVPTQRGELPAGVKWGVAYADGPDSTARKWVVAFDTAAQKAYAEAGPTGPIDWNVVEVKLSFCGSKSEVEDPILGGKCTAEIDGLLELLLPLPVHSSPNGTLHFQSPSSPKSILQSNCGTFTTLTASSPTVSPAASPGHLFTTAFTSDRGSVSPDASILKIFVKMTCMIK